MSMFVLQINQHALAVFCTLTIALTFAATFLPLPAEVIPVVMVFIPTSVAISLAALLEGKSSMRSLLGKQKRVTKVSRAIEATPASQSSERK